LQTYLIT